MNQDRIEELGKQAWEYADSNSRDGDNTFGHLYRDKLAELIIRECISIDFMRSVAGLTDLQDLGVCVAIKKHFGVKE